MQSNKNRLVILVSIFILTTARIVLAGQETLVTGIVTKVRDGDTIEIGGVPIRLKGVSAPELKERFGRIFETLATRQNAFQKFLSP